ncbi:hypothetical protein [Streptomyces sp. NPDC091278]
MSGVSEEQLATALSKSVGEVLSRLNLGHAVALHLDDGEEDG